MSDLLHQLIFHSAERYPDRVALKKGSEELSYEDLTANIKAVAGGLCHLGLAVNDRVGVYLPKLPVTATALFSISLAGGIFVPINPLLKALQVGHILQDCDVRILIVSKDRLSSLNGVLKQCSALHTIVVVNCGSDDLPGDDRFSYLTWDQLLSFSDYRHFPQRIDMDTASIFYTSGSTGKPKGVVLSHKNMVTGAASVAEYLGNTSQDRLVAVLPLSFDYGFSQLSTGFLKGACVVLMDYLLPRDIVNVVNGEKITGLAGVPSLWNQLAQLEWPQKSMESLRYVTNSGGVLPRATLSKIRASLPGTKFYLMYGLTEAFRSTYLPPEEIDKRPGSIGKAVPNAEIMVVRKDGSECVPGERGELVHRGSLVASGYWNNVEKTAKRFKPSPKQNQGVVVPEIALWSGDMVKMDDDGFFYFVGRSDDMIKTSGYRVSPAEIEEAVSECDRVAEVVAFGVPHPVLGQAILVTVVSCRGEQLNTEYLTKYCKKVLPNFMIPLAVVIRDVLPRNLNGKVDRSALAAEYFHMFDLK